MVLVKGNGIIKDFYICDHPVTQSEYKEIISENPSKFTGDNNPVEQVSWYDAVEYCNKRSEKEGFTPCYICSGDNIQFDFKADGYRLPTEKEWDYASEGGAMSNGYKYSGSDIIDDVAWYNGNSGGETHPVKSKKPNKLCIYDMSGNVWEWCVDGNNKDRAYRGGSYKHDAQYCEPSKHYSFFPDVKCDSIGFRVVRNAENSQDTNKENISKE